VKFSERAQAVARKALATKTVTPSEVLADIESFKVEGDGDGALLVCAAWCYLRVNRFHGGPMGTLARYVKEHQDAYADLLLWIRNPERGTSDEKVLRSGEVAEWLERELPRPVVQPVLAFADVPRQIVD
jgi:hypothetical protein